MFYFLGKSVLELFIRLTVIDIVLYHAIHGEDKFIRHLDFFLIDS